MQHRIVAKNIVFQLLTKGVSTFSGFLITILVANALGQQGYGDFTKIITLVGFFYLVVDFGFNALYLQLDPEEKRFQSFLTLRFLLSLLLVVIVNLLMFLLPRGSYPSSLFFSVFVFSLTIITQGIIFCTNAIFQKQHRYMSATYATTIGSLLNVSLIFLFAKHDMSLSFFMGAFFFSSFTIAFLSFLLTKKQWKLGIDMPFFQELLKKTWPVGLMLVVNLIYFRADIFLLSLLKSTQDVGIYGLSYRFFDFLLAIPLFFSNALYPILLSVKGEKQKFRQIVTKYLGVFFLSSFLCVIPFWFASPLFMLIKPGFAASIVPFRILLFSLPVFFLTSFLQWILITLGKQKFLLIVYSCSALLNILFNLIFIPHYSYLASAVLTGVTEGIVLVILGVAVYNAV